jgi:preprotein translocase subunit SecF
LTIQQGAKVRFFKSIDIDFIGNRNKFFAVAGFLILMAIAAFIYRGGPNFGIDFTGGVLMQISFGDKMPALHDMRRAIEEAGVKSFELQSSGNFILIRAKETLGSQEEFKSRIKNCLQAKFPGSLIKAERVEYVGPAVGKHLSKQAVYAFLFAFLGMIVYVAFRFKSSLWGISAVLGVIHDVIACFGFVILVGKEVDITVVAALLTLVGYSINDTIVLFDRIKENLTTRAKENFAAVINKSINEVLVRTVVTSLTVFIVGSALFFFGGEVLHTFAYIMVIGAVLGVFSSVFICAPLVYEWEIRRNNRLKAAIKQGEVRLK